MHANQSSSGHDVRPVSQTVTGWPSGNCVAAAYSSLLGIPIERIPRLDPGAAMRAGQEQGHRERMWLASIGYDLFEITAGPGPDDELSQDVLDCIPEDLPHLMSGISPRGFGHRCVGIGGRLSWDPHPSRAGLVSVYSIGILVPL